MDEHKLKQIIEGVLLVAGEPLSLDRLLAVFPEEERPERATVREVLEQLAAECEGRAVELKEVASGFRYQVRESLSGWVAQLWEERPPRYSRALLETLSLIAYRQPITRAEIEDIRGVTVSTHIMKTLQEREWVRVVGHRDVPGKPAMYATTRQFLDYFNLKSLDELPTLAEIRDIDEINASLALETPAEAGAESGEASEPELAVASEQAASADESADENAMSFDTGAAAAEEAETSSDQAVSVAGDEAAGTDATLAETETDDELEKAVDESLAVPAMPVAEAEDEPVHDEVDASQDEVPPRSGSASAEG